MLKIIFKMLKIAAITIIAFVNYIIYNLFFPTKANEFAYDYKKIFKKEIHFKEKVFNRLFVEPVIFNKKFYKTTIDFLLIKMEKITKKMEEEE